MHRDEVAHPHSFAKIFTHPSEVDIGSNQNLDVRRPCMDVHVRLTCISIVSLLLGMGKHTDPDQTPHPMFFVNLNTIEKENTTKQPLNG